MNIIEPIVDARNMGIVSSITSIGIPEVMGVLGFLLSLALGYIELRRYYLPLKLKVREIEIHRSPDGIDFLGLVRLTFVNPAARGKTVGYIQFGKPSNATIAQPPYEYGEDHDSMKYWIPGTAYVTACLPEDEILRLPLDIPPHQSQSKWNAILFQMSETVKGFDIPKVRVLVVAEDIFGKTLAKYDEEVELKTYTLH